MASLHLDGPESFEVLVCQICLENMVDRLPRTLSCNHTFCTGCLEQLVKDNAVQCPTCRKSSAIERGDILLLPLNFSLGKMQEREMTLILNPEKLCQGCTFKKKKTKATVACRDCSRTMCHDCKEVHDKIPAYRKHTVKQMESGGKSPLCRIHSLSAEHICHKCQVAVCVDCVLSGNHGKHPEFLEDLDSGVKTLRNRLEEEIANLGAELNSAIALSNVIEKDVKFCEFIEQEMKMKAQALICEIEGKVAENLKVLQQDYKDIICDSLISQNEIVTRIETAINRLNAQSKNTAEDLLYLLTEIKTECSSIKSEIAKKKAKAKYNLPYLLHSKFHTEVFIASVKTNMLKNVTKSKEILNLREIASVPLSLPVHVHAAGEDSVLLVDYGRSQVIQINISGKTLASYGEILSNDTTCGLGSYGSNLYISYASGKICKIPCISNKRGNTAVYEVDKEKITSIFQFAFLDEDNVAVVDMEAKSVHTLCLSSNITSTVVKNLSGPAFISISKDSTGKTRYLISDIDGHRVNVYDDGWNRLCSIGGQHTSKQDGMLNAPGATAPIDHTDSFLVADHSNDRVSMFTLDGTFQKHVLTEADGLRYPMGLAYVSPYLWVTEFENIGVGAHVKCYQLE